MNGMEDFKELIFIVSNILDCWCIMRIMSSDFSFGKNELKLKEEIGEVLLILIVVFCNMLNNMLVFLYRLSGEKFCFMRAYKRLTSSFILVNKLLCLILVVNNLCESILLML